MTLRKVLPGIVFLLAIFLVAICCYELMGWSFVDSLFMVVITIFGVGYGPVQPIDTLAEKLFTIILVICGSSAVIYIVGAIIQSITEGEVIKMLGERKKTRDMELLHDHAIICGYGRMGQTLAQELKAADFPFIIIDIDEERLTQATDAGYLCLKGNASEEDTLRQAGIERAKILATVLPQDALNVFITLTARELSKSIRIISRGEQAATEKKLLQAGANEVVLPALIGGLRIAHSIMRPSIVKVLTDSKEIIGQDLKNLGLEVDELSLRDQTQIAGITVRELQKRGEGNFLILALKRAGGEILKSDIDDCVLEEGDSVIVMGRTIGLPASLNSEVKRSTLS